MPRTHYNLKTRKKRRLISNCYSLPYNPDLVCRAIKMRNNPTPAEHKLWTGLLQNFEYKVYRQRPIDHFIADFYCPKLNLVIEIDGSIHNSPEAQAYDAERTKILQSYNLKVIRFSNTEVLAQFECVCRKIKAELKNT